MSEPEFFCKDCVYSESDMSEWCVCPLLGRNKVTGRYNIAFSYANHNTNTCDFTPKQPKRRWWRR